MPLTMRLTVFSSDPDRKDYTIYGGKWAIGRIYREIEMPAQFMSTRPSVPLIPKFASEVAAKVCELRNRNTRVNRHLAHP